MNRMVSVPTEELAGPALDWAITAIEGDQSPSAGQLQLFTQIDTEQLIEKYGIWCERGYHYPWLASTEREPWHRMDGETRTIAVFRAVVWAKHGNTVSVPADLIQL
ncbi:hypothetical protein [Pseudomonas farris]